MVEQGIVFGEPIVPSQDVTVTDPPRAILLTIRETEILRALVNGLSNKEIGCSLGLTEATVKGHVFHLYKKLGIKRRTQAVAKARECNLVN